MSEAHLTSAASFTSVVSLILCHYFNLTVNQVDKIRIRCWCVFDIISIKGGTVLYVEISIVHFWGPLSVQFTNKNCFQLVPQPYFTWVFSYKFDEHRK